MVPPGGFGWIVGRFDDVGFRSERLFDLLPAIDVVAERYTINTAAQQCPIDRRRDTRAIGRVLAVGDDEVDSLPLAQAWQRPGDDLPPRFANDIANQQDTHRTNYRATSVKRASRTTVTLISPGYVS